MRRVIGLCVALVFLGAPRSSNPCSGGDYHVDRPELDLGVVAGSSPEPPVITGAVARECPPGDGESCCISSLEISIAASDVAIFQVDGNSFVERASSGNLVLPFHPGRPPFEVEVVAWKEVGYRSEPARFLVTESSTYGSGGGCG